MSEMHVLFVCTGNTCRSPMAKAIAESIFRKQSPPGMTITVDSAGVFGEAGYEATPEAVEALKRRSVNLSGHLTKGLTAELIKWADLIYTMTPAHAQAVMQLAPGSAGKVFPLDAQQPIADPIGQSIQVYCDVADQLERTIRVKVEEIIQ